MNTGHFISNPSHARSLMFWRFFSRLISLSILLNVALGVARGDPLPEASAIKDTSASIVAQGRLQPTAGILKLSAVPGDRIERISVEPGASVVAGQELVTLESAGLKKLELKIAELKLADAVAMHEAALRQAELGLETAQWKLRSAEQVHSQAKSSLELVGKQAQILRSLEEQIQGLEAIRSNPRLRGAVGSLELEAKRNQKIAAQVEYDRGMLGANQSIQSAELLVAQAQSVLREAKEAREQLKKHPSYRPLEKQIELLRIQLDQTAVVAPSAGTVLQVYGIAGERATALALIELADLTRMSCVAEVHESDVGQVRLGQLAEMKSASLSRPIRGKVSRIDRVVGLPQFRSASPLARSDFRSIAVWIQIDPQDVSVASERLQLQVEVRIEK
ncbi:MAG: efflux RND transporter periplasmic adaptor subunit [Planctomycetota bacterium]|nr:efflux RND transporter periplasmic adaptor subunit [Planctomycetota bacterium]